MHPGAVDVAPDGAWAAAQLTDNHLFAPVQMPIEYANILLREDATGVTSGPLARRFGDARRPGIRRGVRPDSVVERGGQLAVGGLPGHRGR